MTPDQWVLWLPCIIASLVTATVGLHVFRTLTNPMGLANWDFNQSWASNLTIVGGAVSFTILNTLLSKQEMWLLSWQNYSYLALFFPALVALAPVVYNFSREVHLTNANPPQVRIHGRVVTFLFAALLTLWGAAGEVEVQAGLVMSLYKLGDMPLQPTVAAEVLFAAIFCALPVYGWLTMNAAVRSQPDLQDRISMREAAIHARAVGWPLL